MTTTHISRRRAGLSPLFLAGGYVALAIAPLLLAVFAETPVDPWTEAASALGMVAAVMLLLQLVSSGRFEFLSGRVGIDITMAFHKWMARLLVVLVVAHPLFFVLPIDLSRPYSTWNHVVALLTAPANAAGLVTLVLVLLMVPLGMLRDRLPVTHEFWRATHGVMAIVAAVAVLLHLLHVGIYAESLALRVYWIGLALGALALAIGVYTVRLRQMQRQDWAVVARRKRADRLWEISLKSASGRTLDHQAGQFAWIAFAPRRFPLFDHPFSIASPPNAEGEVRFLIQEAGDFTRGLGGLEIGTPAALDGPHGSFTLEDRQCGAIVLIAGGVGLAPILSMLADLARRGETRPVRFVYAARDAAALADPALFVPHLEALGARSTILLDRGPLGPNQRQGPITREHLAEALEGLDPRDTAVMICGPGGMMSAVCQGVTGLGVPPAHIRYERFDYRQGPSTAKDRQVIRNFRLLAMVIGLAVLGFAFR
ncbi:ferredoxin reductase family protein [Oricola sp.]|uniref:ferredoxin reductase family protein n=1 Tax=Oricola sp. TaxID=1979950 RepID=UPI0025D17E76|nr:ferredoxin reductase family protein [Oricola sp.]MCI5077883.1 ferric reductase-like transmembrane domain-containing protein [Oricola sp.]